MPEVGGVELEGGEGEEEVAIGVEGEGVRRYGEDVWMDRWDGRWWWN